MQVAMASDDVNVFVHLDKLMLLLPTSRAGTNNLIVCVVSPAATVYQLFTLDNLAKVPTRAAGAGREAVVCCNGGE